MPLSSREIRSSLGRKGFRSQNTDHKVMVYYKQDGTATHIKTKVSHGPSHDIDDNLVTLMAKQCRINNSQFKRFVECTLSQEDYENMALQGSA